MKTQLSKPARGRASYTEEYKQEALGRELRFVRLGPQVLSRFVQSLGKGFDFGVLMLNSTASYLALRAPESFARLCKTCRVALFDGSVATPFAKSTDPKVDLITVNWKALATRIVNDLAAPRFQLSTQPFVFEAEALCRTPWNSSSNNDLAVMPDR